MTEFEHPWTGTAVFSACPSASPHLDSAGFLLSSVCYSCPVTQCPPRSSSEILLILILILSGPASSRYPFDPSMNLRLLPRLASIYSLLGLEFAPLFLFLSKRETEFPFLLMRTSFPPLPCLLACVLACLFSSSCSFLAPGIVRKSGWRGGSCRGKKWKRKVSRVEAL